MESYKIELFKFLKAPVRLDIFFLVIFLFLDIKMSISLFLSILVHEMAHAWVANKKGYKVYGIDIGLLVGSASIQANINQRDSIPITFAGPLSNILLTLLSFILLLFFDSQLLDSFLIINILLFTFNILPIYPMDGGVILRDILMLNMNRRVGKRIAGKVSLVTSIIVLVVSLYLEFFILSLFAIYFIYTSYKELNEKK